MKFKFSLIGALIGLAFGFSASAISQWIFKDDSSSPPVYVSIERTREIPDRIVIDFKAVCSARGQ